MNKVEILREEINKLQMFEENYSFMMSKTLEKEKEIKNDLKNAKTKELSEPIEAALREITNLKKQLAENHAMAPSRIENLKKEIRDSIKAKQISLFSKKITP